MSLLKRTALRGSVPSTEGFCTTVEHRLVIPGRDPFEIPTTSKSALQGVGFEVIEERRPSFLLDNALLVTGEGSHEDMLALVLTCVQALRRGHYELWKDSMVGTHLAQLDKTFEAPPTRRRKKGQGAEPAE